MFVVLNIG